MTKKIYVIGDVHGCYHTLMRLIKKLEKDSTLIFVGDLVDKGNFSKEVIAYVMQNNHSCLLGNHEVLMQRYIQQKLDDNKTSDWSEKENFGGYKTISQYQDDRDTLKTHLTWISTLPRYIEIEYFFITHAFALPYYKRRDLPEAQKGLISNRPSDNDKWSWDWEEGYESYDVVNIYGHDIVKDIDTSKNHIGIDTGCVYGGRLSAIALHNKQIVSVKVDMRDIS